MEARKYTCSTGFLSVGISTKSQSIVDMSVSRLSTELISTKASNKISVRHCLHYIWSKKTTTAMATRGWRNKRFREVNDRLARVFYNFVRFLVVFGKTRTSNRLTMRKKEPQWLIIQVFWLRTVGHIPMLSWRENLAPLATRKTSKHSHSTWRNES